MKGKKNKKQIFEKLMVIVGFNTQINKTKIIKTCFKQQTKIRQLEQIKLHLIDREYHNQKI